jgi:hypothetical protein
MRNKNGAHGTLAVFLSEKRLTQSGTPLRDSDQTVRITTAGALSPGVKV